MISSIWMVLVWMEPITQDTFKAKSVLVSDHPPRADFVILGYFWEKIEKSHFWPPFRHFFTKFDHIIVILELQIISFTQKKFGKKYWFLHSLHWKVLKTRFGLSRSHGPSDFKKSQSVLIYTAKLQFFKTIKKNYFFTNF